MNCYLNTLQILRILEELKLLPRTNIFELKSHQISNFTKLRMCSARNPGFEAINFFSCSTQLSIKSFLLINVKMPTIVGILTFISRKNSILSLSKAENSFLDIFTFMSIDNFMLS